MWTAVCLVFAACGSGSQQGTRARVPGAPTDAAIERPLDAKSVVRAEVFRCGSRGDELRVKGCDLPMEYSLGKVDPRFGLSRAQVLSAVRNAVSYWERRAGRQLFRHSPGSLFTINLTYDERQEMLQKKAKSGSGNTSGLERRRDDLRAQRQRIIDQLNRKRSDYNAEVARWNQSGGAPPAERRRLAGELRAINELVAAANAFVPRINALVGEINWRRGGARGGFQTGNAFRATRNGVTVELRIDIFAFVNWRMFELVLAHELGHALGLRHVSARSAIMFPVQGPYTQLGATGADLVELSRVCGR